jgi:hypothetical protein
MTLSCCNYIPRLRSSNDESSGSLVERDLFQFKCHDSALKETADSKEKEGEDTMQKDLPKPLPPRRRAQPRPISFWFLPPASLPGPSNMSARKSYLTASNISPSVAPEGESKCLHLGLPSKAKIFDTHPCFHWLACCPGPVENMQELSCPRRGEPTVV